MADECPPLDRLRERLERGELRVRKPPYPKGTEVECLGEKRVLNEYKTIEKKELVRKWLLELKGIISSDIKEHFHVKHKLLPVELMFWVRKRDIDYFNEETVVRILKKYYKIFLQRYRKVLETVAVDSTNIEPEKEISIGLEKNWTTKKEDEGYERS